MRTLTRPDPKKASPNRPIESILLSLLMAGVLLACDRSPPEKPLQYSSEPTTKNLPTIRFAVHPLHNPQKLSEAYQPLIDQLNQQMPELRFELEASRDYQAYEQKFRAREPEILLPNPWQSIEAMKVGYQVIAMAGNAEDFKGIFIVRKDSGITKPSQIKGKTVSYPSHTALAACIMPQYFLHKNGINVQSDIQNTYVGSQESSIMNAYLGKSAVAATWPPPWRLFQKDYPAEAAELKVIWETPSLLNNSVMVRDDLRPEVREKIKAVLLGLSDTGEGQKILLNMSTARFHEADDKTYGKVREYVATFEKEVRKVEAR